MIKRLVAVGVLLLASGKTVAADTGLDLSAIASASNGLNISIDEHNIDSDRSFSVTAYEVVDVPPASSHVSPRPKFSMPAALWLLGSIAIGATALVSRRKASYRH